MTGCEKRRYIASPTGVMRAVETWQLVVPLYDNKGKPFPAGTVDLIREDVIEAFGGDTEVNTVGSWKKNQKVYLDKSIRVEIDIDVKDHDKAVLYMAERKRILKKVLRQKRIYVTFSSERSELLLADEFLEDLDIEFPTRIVDNPSQEEIDYLVECSKNPIRAKFTKYLWTKLILEPA